MFIIAGVSGIIYHGPELLDYRDDPDIIWIFALRMLAILGGILVMRRVNWARWLLVAWIAFHVVISFYHSAGEVIMHGIIMVLVIAALFYPGANAYFRREGSR